MNASPALDAEANGKRTPATLLLVDDNALNRERLSWRLERLGYWVTAVESGEEALARLQATEYDLVLLDSMMPGLSGPAVLSRIKCDERHRDLPVIMISGMDEVEDMARCIAEGATDYLPSPFDPALLEARIKSCLENRRLRQQEALFLKQIQKEKAHSDRLVRVVIPIGVALMEERDLNRLLETILVEAKALCRADGGTLYLRTGAQQLSFVMLLNDSLNIAFGGSSGKPIPFPPLRLFLADGLPNHSQVACYAALTGNSVNLPDAYVAEGFDFHGTKTFDRRTGYRSKSFLTVPLKNRRSEIIGVLQLINAMDATTREVVAFDPSLQQSIESLSLLAAAALEGCMKQQPAAPPGPAPAPASSASPP